ncbi:SLATT domain-containing protein [Streptomyces rhizosphaericus]|uniref:SLATT domain-containing protein n=1 Tax=Streptomyces rhizosphaericus TaxID=114699 RepID=A0A6G4AGA5_9ACTN|nr:SLATT domain-containing protein [Streptomyces rhizosphaericus]NEW72270.1 SLATT domain-containing protein [Streptomyces rhizosphaericus]
MGSSQREELTKEAKRIEESAMWSGQSQFEQSKIWRGTNLWLGTPATALAAIAGAASLVSTAGRYWAAIAALLSAALSAIMTSLGLARRIEEAQVAANAYLALQQDARLFYKVDLQVHEYDEARAALGELVARQQEVNRSAPIPTKRAYRRAGKNIEGGGQTYNVDEASSD